MYNNFNDYKQETNDKSFYTSANYGKGNDDGSYDYGDRGRPRSITVVAWLLVAFTVFGLFSVFSILQYAYEIPGWYWLVLLVNYGLLAAAITGLFGMKKYGVWAFVIQTVLSTVSSFVLGAGSTGILNLVGSVIMLVFVFMKYDQFE